jgi:aspartyl-tRNA(Asn)/glutamyl-tRNA(Gln) amidotransferase subunit C
MDRKTMERVAKAAHLALGEDDFERCSKDLSDIIDLFNILDGLPDIDGYVVNPIEVEDILRDDISGIFVDPYELLKDMKTYENYVRGPRLL